MKKIFLIMLAGVLSFGILAVSCTDQNNPDNQGLIDDGNGGEDESLPACLKGTNYYPILMDGVTFEKIQNKVVADWRPTDLEGTRPLYIWNGYEAATAEGLNFFGNTEGYTAFTVIADAGWSGFGIFLKKDDAGFAERSKIDGTYVLHFAYKGKAGEVHCIYPAWGSKEGRRSVGDPSAAKFEDQGNVYDFLTPISNDGQFVANEWNEYEVAISEYGLDYTADAAEAGGQNIFCALSGGVAGKALNLDAVFIYKK